MATIWILLSRSSHPGRLIQTDPKKSGYQLVEFPFDLWAELREEATATATDEIIRLTQGLPPAAPEFTDIIHRSREMRRVIALARRLAIHDVPVLIQGESGTGKELFARAIHASSRRSKAPFVAVNCGAIPRELFESEFFGHKKGSFTGAIEDRVGYMVQANGGTVFLDEIGELPKEMQVKLLRTLQEGRVRPVGGSKEEILNVRVLAATNRQLLSEVVTGGFREDLFHRLAVGMLTLPPLRSRGEDVGLLVDHALSRINTEAASTIPGWEDKKLSPSGRSLLLQQPWRGNIRELMNTLSRAAIWATGPTIGIETVRDCLFVPPTSAGGEAAVLGRSLGADFDLPALMSDVARHYLGRAMEEADGNKTLAAKLIGLRSYQTLTNWLKKYGLE
jgi:transcriptional regulator with PAS, ATPase and Fis domain